MREIIMSGKPRNIICDLNVLEAIEEKYGRIDAIAEQRSIAVTKFLAAEMINEYNRITFQTERVTPESVGVSMTYPEYAAAWQEIIAEFLDCVIVKKK